MSGDKSAYSKRINDLAGKKGGERMTMTHTEEKALRRAMQDSIVAVTARLMNDIADEMGADGRGPNIPAGFKLRPFVSEADVFSGDGVEQRSTLQIDRQLTPLLQQAFGWAPLISFDHAVWYSQFTPAGRRRGDNQPVLYWDVQQQDVLTLSGFDGIEETIVDKLQLFCRLAQLGADPRIGTPRTRRMSKLILEYGRA